MENVMTMTGEPAAHTERRMIMTEKLRKILEDVYNRTPESITKLFACLYAVEHEIGGFKSLDEFQSVYLTLWQSLEVQSEWVYDKDTHEVSVQIVDVNPPCKTYDAVYIIGGVCDD